ncbi:hypothetical protein BD414DRAFT_130807 [Trametes punicea]|nr:hypothetical protein BD414DRAFT_130807 [Trametes punicea]
MSLPSRPNVGLPSTPRARAFTTGPARSDYPPRPGSSASERPPPPSSYVARPPLPAQAPTIRSQRSLNALPSGPSRSGTVRSRSLERRAESRQAPLRSNPPPPVPDLPSSHKIARGPARARPYGDGHMPSQSVDHYPYRTSEDVMSDSSGVSELSMSPSSIASSRTSLDEGDAREDEKGSGKPAAGHGSSLWASITSVASNLTISVSKAWSSNIATLNGEETPVGGESRLTRAMKAYHIEKARNPADLPEWLFDERERGVRARQKPPAEEREGAPPSTVRPSEQQPPRSLSAAPRREELSMRAARGPTLADRRAGAASNAGSEEHVTKSIARLRALRDAKRNATLRCHREEGDGGADAASTSASDVAAPIPPQNVNAIAMPGPVARERESPMRPTRMPAPLGGTTLGDRGRQPSTRVGLPSGVRPLRA